MSASSLAAAARVQRGVSLELADVDLANADRLLLLDPGRRVEGYAVTNLQLALRHLQSACFWLTRAATATVRVRAG